MEGAYDYEKLGFKCGLEIHQRLATKHKLFCSCDAQLADDLPVAEIDRRQRAVAGELGKTDPSARFEASRKRKFVYNAFRETSCLVETDEEPPHSLNAEALDIALQISASLNAVVPYEFEPMRKEVVDGSDPSAFQRTLLVGQDGHIEFGKRRIKVSAIFLEEESSGIEYSDREMVVYNLDRLGIPLVEIDTEPELKTPEEARDVAKRIGLTLRLTGKVQRGIGSIRQDVNVSISGGARVEIKGFQELDTMDKIIDSEIARQLKLLEMAKSLKEKNAKVHQPIEVTHIFSQTGVKVLRKELDRGGAVFASRLEGFEGIMGSETNPGRRLGSEISDYAKLGGVGGIIHGDENIASYGFSDDEIASLHTALNLHKGDSFMIVSGSKEACKEAAVFACERAEHAIHGVPNETRGVDSKMLITAFLRPLPGGARMYPETDVRPIALDSQKYEKIKKEIVNVGSVIAKLEKEIENPQLAEQMLWSPYLGLFNEIVGKTGVAGNVVAPILLEKTRQIRRMGIDVEKLGAEAMLHIFRLYKEQRLTKAAIEEIMKHTPYTKGEVARLVKEKDLGRISGGSLKKIVSKAAKGGRGREEIIKEIMGTYRLNIDGEELNRLLK